MAKPSFDIVEGQGILVERPFQCEGDLGFPPGYIVVRINFFSEEQTVYIENNSVPAGITLQTNNTPTDGSCNTTGRVEFLINRVSMTMHRRSFQCVIYPHLDIIDGQPMESDEAIVKVVPGLISLFE